MGRLTQIGARALLMQRSTGCAMAGSGGILVHHLVFGAEAAVNSWFAPEAVSDHLVGEELDPSNLEHVLLGGDVLFKSSSGETGVAGRVKPECLSDVRRSLPNDGSGRTVAQFKDPEGICKDPDDTPKDRVAPVPEGEEDVRVLPIVFDYEVERLRSAASSVTATFQEGLRDWSLDGVRRAWFTLEQVARSSRCFLSRHEDLLFEFNTRKSDRAVFEHHCNLLQPSPTCSTLLQPSENGPWGTQEPSRRDPGTPLGGPGNTGKQYETGGRGDFEQKSSKKYYARSKT